MSDIHWATLIEVGSRIEAEIIKEALEAQDIPAEIFQGGAMHYAYVVGAIEICVPNERIKEAKAWLAGYENGQLEGSPGEEDADNVSQEEGK
jgi:hypothetical protein